MLRSHAFNRIIAPGLKSNWLRLVSQNLCQFYLLLFEVQKREGFPTLSLNGFPTNSESGGKFGGMNPEIIWWVHRLKKNTDEIIVS